MSLPQLQRLAGPRFSGHDNGQSIATAQGGNWGRSWKLGEVFICGIFVHVEDKFPQVRALIVMNLFAFCPA